jgi:hypothetical protein
MDTFISERLDTSYQWVAGYFLSVSAWILHISDLLDSTYQWVAGYFISVSGCEELVLDPFFTTHIWHNNKNGNMHPNLQNTLSEVFFEMPHPLGTDDHLLQV